MEFLLGEEVTEDMARCLQDGEEEMKERTMPVSGNGRRDGAEPLVVGGSIL